MKYIVSVVIPTYRHRDYVLLTLESVFAQTFKDYEVIVVNDGSPDDTDEVLKPLIQSGKIRYIEQKNAGQAAARNCGIAVAQGKYIALLDDDDLWPSDKLAWQVQALENSPRAALVYGYKRDLDEPSGVIAPRSEAEAFQGEVTEAFLSRNHITSPGQCLVPATMLERIGGFDASLWGVDDWDLYIRLAKQGPFVYEHRLALTYRLHAQNASRDLARMYQNAMQLRRKQFGLLPSPAHWRAWYASNRWVRQYFGDSFMIATGDAVRDGKKQLAKKLLLQSLLIRPGFIGRRHTYYLLKHII